jgi:hypothetical protein
MSPVEDFPVDQAGIIDQNTVYSNEIDFTGGI